MAAIAMVLFQWAILGGISDLRDKTGSISADVSALKIGVADLKEDVVGDESKEQRDVDKLWTAQGRLDDVQQRIDGVPIKRR